MLINPQLIGLLGAEHLKERIQGIDSVSLVSLLDVLPGATAQIRNGIIRGDDGVEAYQIDADYFSGERSSAEDVLGILDRFNRLAGNFFRWAITPRLQEALGPRELR